MTHQQKLEAIREKVIAAVPEIVELKMGCVVKTPVMGIGAPENEASWFTLIEKDARGKWKVLERYGHIAPSSFREIIGRPIRISDILATFMQSKHLVCIASNERFEVLDQETNSWKQVFQTWYLHNDDLSEQSPETIDFIHSLLCE